MNCVLWTASSTCAYYESTSTPLVVQDAGNVSFGLSVIITLLMVVLVAFLFNNLGGSRRK